jgi:hypothetical protein
MQTRSLQRCLPINHATRFLNVKVQRVTPQFEPSFITLVTVAPSYPVPGLLKRSLLPCPNFTATRIPTTTSSFRFASRLANNLSREYAVTPKPSPLYLLPLSRSSLQLTTVSVRTLKMPPNSKQATLGYVKNPQLTLGWVGGVQCLLYLS